MLNACPFCEIINNKKERILAETAHGIVVLSNPRLVAGHTLVIPKRHVLKLSELTREERHELLDTVIEFQEKIISKIATGCDIRQNYRPFIKQSDLKIDHVHVHLIPRELEDELYQKSMRFEKEVFAPLTENERQKIFSLLQ